MTQKLHNTVLIDDLKNSLENDLIHTDISINLPNGEVRVHKFMLATRSTYFKELFEKEDDDGHKEHSLQNSIFVFKKVIEYIYCGAIDYSGFSLAESIELLDLTRLLHLDQLFEEILLCTIQNATGKKYPMKDCLVSLENTISLKLEPLAKNLAYHIAENMEEIIALDLEVSSLPAASLDAIQRAGVSRIASTLKVVKELRTQNEKLNTDLKKVTKSCAELKKTIETEQKYKETEQKLTRIKALRNSVNEKFSKSKDFVENMQKKLLMKAYDDEGSDEFDMQ